jgi:hypothetical protein
MHPRESGGEKGIGGRVGRSDRSAHQRRRFSRPADPRRDRPRPPSPPTAPGLTPPAPDHPDPAASVVGVNESVIGCKTPENTIEQARPNLAAVDTGQGSGPA